MWKGLMWQKRQARQMVEQIGSIEVGQGYLKYENDW